MRTAHLILTLLVCFGTMAVAQESSGSKTTAQKKKTSGAGSSETSASSKSKTTSSGTAASSSTASKSKPKSTSSPSSGSKTANTNKETAAKKEQTSKEGESKKGDSTAATAGKGSGAIRAENGEKKETPTSKITANTTTKDGAAMPSSKKSATDSDKLAEDGTDERDPTKAGKKAAAVSSITPEEIEGFDSYPAATQQLIRRSLELTTQNLRYQFGSADPKAGGMDCSGTMYRVLQDAGIKDVPRQSDEICRWVMRRSLLYRTEDTSTLKDKSLSALKPGDLLFWTGTYETSNPRELPISHVMLYLGKRKKDGKPVVFGASDGRTYDGQRRNGVSIFDFVMPRREGKAAFYGYGPVPGLNQSAGDAAGQ